MAIDGALVVIVEDDEEISGAIAIVVERLGHRPKRFSNGKDALRGFFEETVDLVILDVGLPQMDGWQVLERIRELSDVPVLMLTALDRENDKVRGLSAGADDYVTKPFSVRELGARIEALIRRGRLAAPAAEAPDEMYRDGDLVIDRAAREVLVGGERVSLTPLEFQLLQTFIEHEGQALSVGQLLRLVWDDHYGTAPDRVKFAVLRLRRKLGWVTHDDTHVEAIRGYGYRYRRST
jgi:DNA-binding response OmpR family regulator